MTDLRVLFVEPPKDFWFILGQYISPPIGILALAAYLESKTDDIEIIVLDCQAEAMDWNGLERYIARFQPDVVAPSGLGTTNAYAVLRVVEIAKKVDQSVKTVVGGQHFTALDSESLRAYPEIDYVVRGEGEQTLLELMDATRKDGNISEVKGLSFRNGKEIIRTPERPLIEDLDSLPYPGYHLVEKHMSSYYFSLMAEKDASFAIVEGARGCGHSCSYCSQCHFWRRRHRAKSPERVADEIEHINDRYGSSFFWLTDDNLGLGKRVARLAEEILERELDITWFCQARSDEIVRSKKYLPTYRKSGCIWMLVGLEWPTIDTSTKYRRENISRSIAKESVTLLRENDIFIQGSFIIGDRSDSHDSIDGLREYADWLDPDIATFMILTPFPGTEIFETAKEEGWIENMNWSDYDMIHAIMPTEHLTIDEVQQELYKCYQHFFGSWPRRYRGLFSRNPITKRTYQYLARQAIITGLKSLF